MTPEFPPENVLMLIGAAQGILISALILQKHRALFANRFLAGMMISISAILVNLVIEDLGWFTHIRFLFPALLALPLAVPPLHYLYSKYLTNRASQFNAKEWLHFLPFVLTVLIACISLLVEPSWGNVFSDPNIINNYPPFLLAFNWTLVLQASVYVTLVLKRIHRYNRHIRDVYSSIETIQLQWLQNITWLAASAWFVFFVENFFLTFGINISNFMISSVLIAVYLFTLGYLGMLKSIVLESLSPVDEIETEVETSSKVQNGETAKYEKSGLAADAARQYEEALLELMENKKPYMSNDLTLSQLAGMLNVSPHNLSEVINRRLNKNFYDLINEYRIGQVKRDLVNPAKKNLKLLSIAFDAGFNSKATFNTVFKQATHLTPSEFRKQSLIAAPKM